MKNKDLSVTSPELRVKSPDSPDDLIALLSKKVVGQSAAMKHIVPYVHMFQSGLSPEGRPAGVFLLLGLTGTGKTRTVEAIAEVLHGNAKNLLKIDCGEFQMEHEVAKLIGSPPGYLGHRETQPMLSQQQVDTVASPNCPLSLVLFDEIEKAAPSLTRLLLGILDRAKLRLGDNTTVDFEKSLIFFTSNLGAREMIREINPDIGFQGRLQRPSADLASRMEGIALAAVRKRFSPEFINRIDAVVTYHPLDSVSLATILDQNIAELQNHVNTRLGARCFHLEALPESLAFLLKKGTSEEYGARELKRTIHRELTQPLATLVAAGSIPPGSRVMVSLSQDQTSLVITAIAGGAAYKRRPLSILIVDDNKDLLLFLEQLMKKAGWEVLTAPSAEKAREVFARSTPSTVLLDYVLGTEDGVTLGLQIQLMAGYTDVIIMTGGELAPEEEMICRERDMPILRKPFLDVDVLNIIRSRSHKAAARSAS